MTAGAATTVSPTEPGSPPFTRNDTVNITVNPVAALWTRTLATSNFSRSSILLASCVGDNPAGVNNSPRTIVKVTGPGGEVILNATSPVLTRGIAGATGGYPESNPQPAPADTNWRGGSYGSTTPGAPATSNLTRPWVAAANLAGKPGGIYTVETTTQNMVKTGAGACTVGTPPVAATSTGFGNTFTAGTTTETSTFEYRPWQYAFTDVLGNGKVNANTVPKEFQPVVGTTFGAVHQGTATNQRLFALPGANSVMLPADPTSCAENPSSCLPSTAIECPQVSATCQPRVMIINYATPTDVVQGLFDLETKAFVARVTAAGRQRYMFSLGTEADAAYRDLLNQLNAAAQEQGLDLMAILSTTVRVRLNANEYKLSLLNGLQIDPKAAGTANGVQIVSDYTAQAGLILDLYIALGGACTATSGDSNPATAQPDRYAKTADSGYDVEKSDLLPEVPRVGAAGALVGGPIYHIEGDFVGSATPLAAAAYMSQAVIGVDTAADEPNGYPVWIQPFLSAPSHVTRARTMDFLGTATWSASETPITGVGCLITDFMLGAGVAIFNNPLPVGFGDLPIWDPQSPEVQALMAQVNAAVQEAVNGVASDPTVAALLAQITGALPI